MKRLTTCRIRGPQSPSPSGSASRARRKRLPNVFYASAHWPSDVLGSYLFGALGVVAIASLYIRVKEDRLHRPRLWKKRPAPPPPAPNGIKIAHSIASTVYLDPQAGTAAKEYNPPLFIRALHRLSFQAPFSYQHNRDSLEAAAAKRVIVGLLTRHWFG